MPIILANQIQGGDIMRQVGIISCESFDNFSTGGSAEEYDRIKVARERNNTLAHELSLSLSLDLLKSMTG